MQLHQHEMSIQLCFRSLETVVNFSPFCLYEILPLESRNCLLDSNAPKKRDTGRGKWNSVSRGNSLPSMQFHQPCGGHSHVLSSDRTQYWVVLAKSIQLQVCRIEEMHLEVMLHFAECQAKHKEM